MLAAIDFEKGISDAWGRVAEFVPKLLGFLLILIIGFLIAKAIGKNIDKVLEREGLIGPSSVVASRRHSIIPGTTRLSCWVKWRSTPSSSSSCRWRSASSARTP